MNIVSFWNKKVHKTVQKNLETYGMGLDFFVASVSPEIQAKLTDKSYISMRFDEPSSDSLTIPKAYVIIKDGDNVLFEAQLTTRIAYEQQNF